MLDRYDGWFVDLTHRTARANVERTRRFHVVSTGTLRGASAASFLFLVGTGRIGLEVSSADEVFGRAHAANVLHHLYRIHWGVLLYIEFNMFLVGNNMQS